MKLIVAIFRPERLSVGLDVSQHGEEAYARGEGAVLVRPGATTATTPIPQPAAVAVAGD